MYTYIYVYIYIYVYTYIYIHIHAQPIPFGVKNAVSKLKAQISNVSFATFQLKETSSFEF